MPVFDGHAALAWTEGQNGFVLSCVCFRVGMALMEGYLKEAHDSLCCTLLWTLYFRNMVAAELPVWSFIIIL